MLSTPKLSRRAVLAAGASIAALSLPASARAGLAPDFVGIDAWLNSGPLSMAGLRGRVVVVNFWTHRCINCIHSLPFVLGWYARYAARGFTVVGVHTPEFEVEKSLDGLREAVARFGLRYPIAQDNESATWNAWGNQYWPAEYLVDQRGRIVHSHAGEGGYAEMEGRIGNLLG